MMNRRSLLGGAAVYPFADWIFDQVPVTPGVRFVMDRTPVVLSNSPFANPDPTGWSNLAVSVSIGNRNPIASDDEFLTASDARFPTYAKPATVGFSLAPGAFTTQSFQVTIPTGVEKTGYFGNSVLLQISFHDIGQYLDRGCFFFDVV